MNFLEQLYEGALNPADSVVYTDEYDCLQEKIEGLGDHIKRILQTDSERELCNEFLDVCNEQECLPGVFSGYKNHYALYGDANRETEGYMAGSGRGKGQ